MSVLNQSKSSVKSNERPFHQPTIAGLALLALAALAPAARAAVLTQTHSYSQAIDSSGRNSIAVAQFDPALGTLQSIRLGIAGDGFAYTSGTFENTSGVTQTGTVNITSSIQVYGSIVMGDGLVASQEFTTIAVPYDLEPGAQFDHSGTAPAYDVSTSAVTAPTTLSPYIGTGTHNISTSIGADPLALYRDDDFTYIPLAGSSVTGSTTITITYTYDAVPEPAALALLALSPVLLLRTRRRARACEVKRTMK